ncbi:MAG: F0F1 ATP synthase subunit epsilon [Gammaproteobacteria bacterium AqS3]|nr:F0F1 ATP synthase subunit epsilon [Gammaproteobacteria bacterium AqS3]
MTRTMRCEIVSAQRELFSGEIESIVAPGAEGELGILPGHTPLLTPIRPGPLRVILEGGQEQVFFISGGFIEVQPEGVIVLSDTGVRAADIDEAAAEKAREEAERLLSSREGDFDYASAAAELADAVARIRTIKKLRERG